MIMALLSQADGVILFIVVSQRNWEYGVLKCNLPKSECLCLPRFICDPSKMGSLEGDQVKGRDFMNGISTLIKETPESPFLLLPYEGTARRPNLRTRMWSSLDIEKSAGVFMLDSYGTLRNNFLLCMSHPT
jgi:hypothetical protein